MSQDHTHPPSAPSSCLLSSSLLSSVSPEDRKHELSARRFACFSLQSANVPLCQGSMSQDHTHPRSAPSSCLLSSSLLSSFSPEDRKHELSARRLACFSLQSANVPLCQGSMSQDHTHPPSTPSSCLLSSSLLSSVFFLRRYAATANALRIRPSQSSTQPVVMLTSSEVSGVSPILIPENQRSASRSRSRM